MATRTDSQRAGTPMVGDEWIAVALIGAVFLDGGWAVSYTHLRAHETVLDLVCRLLLEKKKHKV